MSKKINVFLVLIIALATVLRIYQLSTESLFVDEAIVFWKSQGSVTDMVKFWFSGGHFPTYYIMMHYWVKIFGTSEAAVRFPSVIFGVLSIGLVFLLARRLFDEKIALVASFFLALNTISIYYSQCARPYSISTCFTILSFLTLLTAIRTTASSPG